MEACQFAAACGCQRTQIITRRDRRRPWLFIGLDVWKGKKKDAIYSFELFFSSNKIILLLKIIKVSSVISFVRKTQRPAVILYVWTVYRSYLLHIKWRYLFVKQLFQNLITNDFKHGQYVHDILSLMSNDFIKRWTCVILCPPPYEWSWSGVNATVTALWCFSLHLVVVTSPAVFVCNPLPW